MYPKFIKKGVHINELFSPLLLQQEITKNQFDLGHFRFKFVIELNDLPNQVYLRSLLLSVY